MNEERVPLITKQQICEAWGLLDKGYVWAVREEYDNKASELIIESPEFRMDVEGVLEMEKETPFREAVVRVFLSQKEALFYGQLLKTFLGVNADLSVLKTKLTEVFRIRGRLQEYSLHEFETEAIRIDVCTMQKSEWPVRVDTLWARNPTTKYN